MRQPRGTSARMRVTTSAVRKRSPLKSHSLPCQRSEKTANTSNNSSSSSSIRSLGASKQRNARHSPYIVLEASFLYHESAQPGAAIPASDTKLSWRRCGRWPLVGKPNRVCCVQNSRGRSQPFGKDHAVRQSRSDASFLPGGRRRHSLVGFRCLTIPPNQCRYEVTNDRRTSMARRSTHSAVLKRFARS